MKEKYLVILALMVIATVVAVGLVFWSNRNLPAETLTKMQKAANPCFGLVADTGEINCEVAKVKILQKYPGAIQRVERAIIANYEGEDKETPKKIFKTVWLFDISLTTPLSFTEQKIRKEASRVKLAVDVITGEAAPMEILWQ